MTPSDVEGVVTRYKEGNSWYLINVSLFFLSNFNNSHIRPSHHEQALILQGAGGDKKG